MIPTDEIIKMAKEAAQSDGSADHAGREVVLYAAKTPKFLERFAALVSARAAKDERESCAKVCEEKGKSYIERASQPRVIKDIDDWTAEIAAMACDFAATAIRARGDKDEQ